MNRCFFIGQIKELSDYKFFYNSKVHNAEISLKIHTIENKYQKSETIILKGYDEIADTIYQNYATEDIVVVEGELIKNIGVNILDIEKYQSIENF